MQGARAHGGGRRRWRAHHALLLVLAAACTQSLDLDGYSFQPGGSNAGAGGGGQLLDNLGGSGNDGQSGSHTGAAGAGGFEPDGGLDGDPDAGDGNDGGAGSTGYAGSSGSAGASGASGAGGAGNGGAGGFAGSSGSSGSGGSGGSSGASGAAGAGGGGGCSSGSVCVPAIPSGWSGPIAVSRGGGASGCPASYATSLGNVFNDLQAGAVTCNCGCFVDSIACRLQERSTGNFFAPTGTCAEPETADECLDLVPDATCDTTPVVATFTANTWGTTERTCGGAASTGACTNGACYAEVSSFGSTCISQNGDLACPAGFGVRSIFYRNYMDTRACGGCSCELQGDQACEMEIEVCSVGIYQQVLDTYGIDGPSEICLNSSDGDSVHILTSQVKDVGNCDAYPDAATGTVTPVEPVTVCCL